MLGSTAFAKSKLFVFLLIHPLDKFGGGDFFLKLSKEKLLPAQIRIVFDFHKYLTI